MIVPSTRSLLTNARHGANKRHAFTLFETLVTVAIIVIIAGLGWPALQTMLADSKVYASNDYVRARIAETRALAMEHGQPFQIGIVPGSRWLQIAPVGDSSWDSIVAEELEDGTVLRSRLPDGIFFVEPEQDMAPENKSETVSGKWQPAAIFLPNGSAVEDATIGYGLGGHRAVRMKIRGLTGVTKLVDPAVEAQQ